MCALKCSLSFTLLFQSEGTWIVVLIRVVGRDVYTMSLCCFSGLGYITGGETARITGHWQWGLRITPVLGVIAILLLLTVVKDPIRGEREGGVHLTSTEWSYDIKQLLKK